MKDIKEELIKQIKEDEGEVNCCLLITNDYTLGYCSIAEFMALIAQALVHKINHNEIELKDLDYLREVVKKESKKGNIEKEIDELGDLLDELKEKLGD